MRPRHAAAAALLLVPLAVGACTSAATPSPSPRASGTTSPSAPASERASTVPSASASLPPPSHGPTTEPSASTSTASKTDTPWGRIWDAVPAAFPKAADAMVVEPDEPASLAYDTPVAAADVATELQSAMELAGYSTEAASGPLEGGERVLDSVGDPLTCHVQTTITPRGTMTHVTVLYGAPCPAP